VVSGLLQILVTPGWGAPCLPKSPLVRTCMKDYVTASTISDALDRTQSLVLPHGTLCSETL
jgi:hypothetical protein